MVCSLQGAVLVYFFWIPGLGSSQGWMFPRVGHQGEQGSGCVAWERSGMGLLEVISIPFPSLGISIRPHRAGFSLGADAALRNSVLKKLYPCKCLLIRVSRSALVPPLTAGAEQARSSHFHLSLGIFWEQHLGQDLFLAGGETLTWPESVLWGGLLPLRPPHTPLPPCPVLSRRPLPRAGLMVPSDASPL